MEKTLRILGIRGLPAKHGGFETFAESFALYLVKHGWRVVVYCQAEADQMHGPDVWRGVELVHIPVRQQGALGTIVFDWKSTRHAARSDGLILTLGYNTAVFCALYRLRRRTNLINMDGIEWKRDKWSRVARTWLLLNEFAGCWLANHLIADNPEIAKHLKTRVTKTKITMIPYGSTEITDAEVERLADFGLTPHRYAIVVARPEPENSILEIVTAFSQMDRGFKLVVLGNFEKANPEYRKRVFEAASAEVLFPGAIYESQTLHALRYFAVAYVHGHRVGGTNPSLVEALGAGSPVIAHDNKFNRWVAGDKNLFFFFLCCISSALASIKVSIKN